MSEQSEHSVDFRAIYQNLAAGIVVLDREGSVLHANPAMEELLGYELKDLTGMPFSKLLHPEDVELDAIPHEELRSGKRDSYFFEKRVMRKNGHLLWVLITHSAIRDEDGQSQNEVLVVEDIHRRKLADETFEHQLERLRAIIAINKAVSASMDLKYTLSIVLEQVVKQTRVDAGSILLLNPKTYQLEFATGLGFRTDALRYTHLRMGEGYAGQAALERRPVFVTSLIDAGEFERSPLFTNENFISYYAIPLITKGQVRGVLELFTRQTMKPGMDWVDFVEAMMQQVSSTIDTATAFQDVQRSFAELSQAFDLSLDRMASMMDSRQKRTKDCTLRLADQTARLARNLGMSEPDILQLRRGVLLHHLGETNYPEKLLMKTTGFTPEEEKIIHSHPQAGYEVIAAIKFLRPAADIALCHHEKWDGSGYPRGLKEEEIPFGARIFAVVNAWEELGQGTAALTVEQKTERLNLERDKAFDPRVVDAFVEMLRL